MSERKLFLIPKPTYFVFGIFALAWAIGFSRYLGVAAQGVIEIGGVVRPWTITLFPFWPNILDVIGLCVLGVFLLFEAFKR